MPQFPIKEAEIVALATSIEGGLPSDPIFASPPVSSAQIGDAVSTFNEAASLAEQKRAEAAQATAAKADDLAALVAQMRSVLDWALARPGVTEAQLRKIDWGFPAPPTGLALPGQCRELQVESIAGSTVEFAWKKPLEGGRASGYKLYRRAAGSTGAWILEDALFGISHTRDEEHDFPSGTWDVVVTATNATGEGPVSNTVTVTVA
jgi:hypothetical protein